MYTGEKHCRFGNGEKGTEQHTNVSLTFLSKLNILDMLILLELWPVS